MPVKSGKQYRFMRAAARGDIAGVSPEVGKKFISETPREKRKHYARLGRKDK